eukprot:58047-Rhodomonas_salina.2
MIGRCCCSVTSSSTRSLRLRLCHHCESCNTHHKRTCPPSPSHSVSTRGPRLAHTTHTNDPDHDVRVGVTDSEAGPP